MGKVYLGVDFHSSKIVTHRIERRADEKILRTNGSFFPENLSSFIRTLDLDTYVCVEASSGVFEFCEKIRPYVKEVIVIHPLGFRRMYLSGKKTDRVDAKNLADRLKAHIEDDDSKDDFPSVWIPPAAIRELREMFSCLQLLKTQINRQKNKMRSILRLHLSFQTRDVDVEIMNFDEFELSETVRWMLKQLQGLLCSTLIVKKQLEERIRRAAITYDESTVRLLVTIYGVSILGASALLADAGCIERFKTAKKFCRYMRSAPRVDSSNETTKIGSIDKAGRKTAFGYLVEGLLNIYAGNPNYTKFYQTKCIGKSKGKVRAALVRKTLTAIFYIWKNREEYRFKHDMPTLRKIKEVERIKKLIRAA
jgi:Transposase and inactivated derivatives